MPNAPPKLFVVTAQLLGGLAHWQVLAQRQRQGLKKQRKTTAFARPGKLYLGGFVASIAIETWQFCVQPGFALKIVQMSPLAFKAVMNALAGLLTQRAQQIFGITGEVEVDALLNRAELDGGNTPQRSLPQSTAKQRLNLNRHIAAPLHCLNHRSVDLRTTRQRDTYKLHHALLHFFLLVQPPQKTTKGRSCEITAFSSGRAF